MAVGDADRRAVLSYSYSYLPLNTHKLVTSKLLRLSEIWKGGLRCRFTFDSKTYARYCQ